MAIIVVGSSCTLHMFSVRNSSIASLARPSRFPAAAIARMALSPAGVAAPPMPSMSAARFTLMSESACSSPGAKRNSRKSGLRSAFASAPVTPLSRSTPSSPPKNAYAPAMLRQKATASAPPPSSASCAADSLPCAAAAATPISSIMQNTAFIASPRQAYALAGKKRRRPESLPEAALAGPQRFP